MASHTFSSKSQAQRCIFINKMIMIMISPFLLPHLCNYRYCRSIHMMMMIPPSSPAPPAAIILIIIIIIIVIPLLLLLITANCRCCLLCCCCCYFYYHHYYYWRWCFCYSGQRSLFTNPPDGKAMMRLLFSLFNMKLSSSTKKSSPLCWKRRL